MPRIRSTRLFAIASPGGPRISSVFSGVSALYALRSVFPAPSIRPLVRVRRSTDNAEADVNSISTGALDVYALGRHVRAQNLGLNSGAPSVYFRENMNLGAAHPDPEGQPNAVVFEANGGVRTHRVQASPQSVNYVAGTTYTLSYFVKPLTQTVFQLVPAAASFQATAFANFVLTGAGSVGSTADVTSASVSRQENGYYRISITLTATASATAVSAASVFWVTSASAPRGELADLSTSAAVTWSQVSASSTLLIYSPTTSSVISTSESGFVTTWYEQAFGLDAIQTTAANQPRIVDAGVLETDGGLPTLRFLNASRHNLVMPLLGIFDDSYSVNFVGRFDTPPTADWNIAVGNKSTVDTTIPGIALYRGVGATSGASRATLTGNGVTRNLLGSVSQNYPYRDIVTLTRAPMLASLFSNGALQVSSNAITASEQPSENTGVRLGGLAGTRSFQGALSEVSFFPTALTDAQRQAIERNQGNFYGITVA